MKKVAAAVMLFTRLPLWRVVSTSQTDYSDAVVFWPLVGWLTAGVTAAALLGFSYILPGVTAVILALCIRLLLTGALHEDGLADFFDAFGGGGSKERILTIMKDSHIGTYGVIALIAYNLLWVSALTMLPPFHASLVVLGADPFCKFCAGQLTNTLPYARPEGSKNKVTYARMSVWKVLMQAVFGLLPLLPLYFFAPRELWAVVAPVAVFVGLRAWMKHKIGGYTGDCCGATYLLCELSMLLSVAALSTLGL